MSRGMKFLVCVVSVVAVTVWPGTLRAGVLYNVNTEMYASENGSSPSATFGTWSCGNWSAVESTDFNLDTFTTPLPDPNIHGWGTLNNNWISTVGVNYNDYPVFIPTEVPSTALHIHAANGAPGVPYPVLRWTAPSAGTIEVSLDQWSIQATTLQTDVVFNGGLLATTVLPADHSHWTPSLAPITVVAGDTLDIVVGASGIGPAGTWLSINMVPEPSSVMLLATGLIGLLCYAWRKRK
jgi:hypothetical protein